MTEGSIRINGHEYETGQMMVFRPGDRITILAAEQGARLMLLGGATMNEHRYIWWNFVSSSKERIEEAKEAWKEADWLDGKFSLPPGDTSEHIPITEELERSWLMKR